MITNVTKDKALTMSEFHIARPGQSCQVWRRNGRTQTWKRSPARFRVPVKWGLYRYGQVTELNAHLFHLAGDCPGLSARQWELTAEASLTRDAGLLTSANR